MHGSAGHIPALRCFMCSLWPALLDLRYPFRPGRCKAIDHVCFSETPQKLATNTRKGFNPDLHNFGSKLSDMRVSSPEFKHTASPPDAFLLAGTGRRDLPTCISAVPGETGSSPKRGEQLLQRPAELPCIRRGPREGALQLRAARRRGLNRPHEFPAGLRANGDSAWLMFCINSLAVFHCSLTFCDEPELLGRLYVTPTGRRFSEQPALRFQNSP